MNRQCERLIGILSQPVKGRQIDEIHRVTDWLRDTVPCLRTVESGIVHELVRLGVYKKCLRDEVIVSPGQKEDGMYVILSGVASVYSKQKHRDFASEVTAINEQLKDATTTTTTTTNTTTTATTTTIDDGSTISSSLDSEPSGIRSLVVSAEKKPGVLPSTAVSDKLTPDKPNREKLGKLVAKFSVGKCVGGAVQRTDESIKNATVVCDDTVHLLHLTQQVYDETLKPSQEKELAFRRKFIGSHPLFAGCSGKVKQLLEMMLTKQFYPSGQPIVRQGDPYDGLVFILSGQANVVVEPNKHRTQYSHLLTVSTNQKEEIQTDNTTKKSKKSESESNRANPILEPIRIRRKYGYATAEKRLRSRQLNVCCAEKGELVGDIELVARLDTYCQTVTPTEPVDAFVLTAKTIERIGSKAFSQSMNVLKQEVETKLGNRIERLRDNGPALFPCLLQKMRYTDEERPVDPPPLVSTKSLPSEEELFQHLLKSFLDNRSPLVRPYVSGGIFYRDMMRTKALQRRSAPEALKPSHRAAVRMKVRPGQLKPLTTRAIKDALRRQEDELEKVEETARLHEMRCMEEERTRSECEKVKLDYQLNSKAPPLTEKAMMNLQQVLLNKIRHQSMQNSLPLDTDIEVRNPRSKVATTDPFKILLQSPGPIKTTTRQASKASDWKSSEKAKLEPISSPDVTLESGSLEPPTNAGPKTQNDNEMDYKKNPTDIKSLPMNNDNTVAQEIMTNDIREHKQDTNSSAIRNDETIREDSTKTENKRNFEPTAIQNDQTTKGGSRKKDNCSKTNTDAKNPSENAAKTDDKFNEKSTSAADTGTLLESADKIGLQLERTKTLLSELDRHSEPADLQTDVDDQMETVREVHSARADLNLFSGRNPASKEIRVDTRRMKEAVVLTLAKELCEERARNRLNKDLVSAEDALYESPSYRDWETSDRSLRYLEERIARFHVETEKEILGKTPKPPLLPKLRRFEPTDDHPKHAAPGGKVYVKRRACDMHRTNGAVVKNHDHVRYHLLPSIPNYSQLRTSKMVMFQMLDDARQQWINEH